MYTISIDGACRRNGKPNCISSGGVFVQHHTMHYNLIKCKTIAVSEKNSTNQRGELLALIEALRYVVECTGTTQDIQIVTDSEYIYNAMTKAWFVGWESRGWLTAAGEPVKNADLWKSVAQLYKQCADYDIVYYHIKGHCIPFGRVTADRLLEADSTGQALLQETYKKFDASLATKRDVLRAAQELSYRNNGFYLPEEVFRRFVVANVVVDAIATKEVDAADSRS